MTYDQSSVHPQVKHTVNKHVASGLPTMTALEGGYWTKELAKQLETSLFGTYSWQENPSSLREKIRKPIKWR